MDLPAAGRSTLEAEDQEEHLSPPENFCTTGSFSLGTINQSSVRESKLKNLRRTKAWEVAAEAGNF